MLLITTSRRPSHKTRRFCNSLKILPHSYRKNRGSSSIKDLLNSSYQDGFSRCIIVNTRHGNPAEMVFYKNKKKKSFKFVMLSVKMREHASSKRTPKFTKLSVNVEEEIQSLETLELKRFFSHIPEKPFEEDTGEHERKLILNIKEDILGIALEFVDGSTSEILLPKMRGFIKVN